jgi:DNA polymerase-3 subunit alpha
VNKKAIEALIKCGAFGSTGASRKGMLSVLEQAQAAGQKAQQDAEIGQGSIFDMMDFGGGGDDGLGGGAGSGGGPALPVPIHAPIPAEEFDRSELLAAEKESIGLYISEHPLKELGPALQAKADCSLADLAGKRDGDWVTVGGMITQARKFRTKKGDPMMCATHDDLETSVEMVVFGKTLGETKEDALAVDAIVLVRGRVDHKDREKTCIVVQQIDPFQPSDAEVEAARVEAEKALIPPAPLRLALDAGSLPVTALGELKDLLTGFPGESDVVIELRTSTGARRLRLGPGYRVARSPSLHAELDALLGAAIVADRVAGTEPAAPVGGA